MVIEGRAIAHMQVSELVSAADSAANTLQYDGTRKFGLMFGSFQLATDSGSYT